MPFILSNETSKTFEKEGYLRIEDFFSEQVLSSLKDNLYTQFKEVPKDFKSRYLASRDLFREQLEIKKVLMKRDFQKLMSQLCQNQKIIYAFDQVWDCRQEQPFFERSMLQDIASVSPLRLGVMIGLEGEGTHEHFPQKPNEALFFLPWRPIPWNEAPKGQLFLLIGYALFGAVYKENEKDPNTNLLKRLDYQVNQPLHIKTHPRVKRSS